jgi:hypothetical protein
VSLDPSLLNISHRGYSPIEEQIAFAQGQKVLGNHLPALQALKSADIIAKDKTKIRSYLGSTLKRIQIFKMFGAIYEELETWQDAYDSLRRVVDLTTQLFSRDDGEDDHSLGTIFLRLGALAHRLDKLDDCLYYYYKGIEIQSLEKKDIWDISIAAPLLNIADVYQ